MKIQQCLSCLKQKPRPVVCTLRSTLNNGVNIPEKYERGIQPCIMTTHKNMFVDEDPESDQPHPYPPHIHVPDTAEEKRPHFKVNDYGKYSNEYTVPLPPPEPPP